MPSGRRRDLLLALVVTGVVNQVFANGIVFSEASLPFAFAVALLCVDVKQPNVGGYAAPSGDGG